ncbi:putative F-box/LRR-repeat protein 23 [Solanum stenotomum]|uniref:putative F-box/LRR-repeat protein 23 n=1 Tax=Solanum stenotomum TaxID=172797 RepID=UPI0020D08284|nr:putative F-box/LRR-repeat protein 23 [Solanum stenotomum]
MIISGMLRAQQNKSNQFASFSDRSTQLRHLRVVMGFYEFAGGLAVYAKNFPYLEELHMHFNLITQEDIDSVGRSCSLLKSFLLNAYACDRPKNLHPDDGQALAIARSMPELRHLGFLLNTLTNVGLQAILDGCPHLVSLDLHYYNIDLEGDIGRRCRQQIVDLRQPHASTHDYEFDYEVWLYFNYWSSDNYDSADDSEDENW